MSQKAKESQLYSYGYIISIIDKHIQYADVRLKEQSNYGEFEYCNGVKNSLINLRQELSKINEDNYNK